MHELASLYQYLHKLSSALQNEGHPKINKVDVGRVSTKNPQVNRQEAQSNYIISVQFKE